MNAQATDKKIPAPDKVPLNRIQASRLSGLTGINQEQFNGRTVAEISERYRWQIDPEWFFFRRICGKVVKQDPVTGVQYPVPYATVYAEDTDCSFLGLFPPANPWSWFFPIHCTTEIFAETTTDACGNFCVWVPRFEIEWILRFRLERRCYFQIFTKPNVGNIIQYLQGKPVGPDPAPDGPVSLKPGSSLYKQAEQVLGAGIVRQLAAVGSANAFGARSAQQQAVLSQPAFAQALAPALPRKFKKNASIDADEHRHAVRGTLASDLGVDAAALERLDLRRYYGPFLRCYEVLVPEWVPFFEVPDISFRVTQDVNGTVTTIYGGGFFDVPWSTDSIGNVTLLANSSAFATTGCNTPPILCNNVPALESAGQMPMLNPAPPAAPYIDLTTGFATRPNRPHPHGTLVDSPIPPATSLPLATAPFCETLALYGCNQVDGAAFYRVLYTHTPPGSTTPSAQLPLMGSWPIARLVGSSLVSSTQAPDGAGWYPVLNPADGWIPPNDNTLLQEWDTSTPGDGLVEITIEVGDAAKNHLAYSPTVPLVIDNSYPKVNPYTAVYSYSADISNPQPVPTDDCVVIDRGIVPQDVYIQITFGVTAQHLRSVNLNTGGCAGGAVAISPTSVTQHWYENVDDNSFSGVAVYKIPATSPQGVYSFNLYTDSRAFNPAGGDGGLLDDWNYNPAPIWTQPSFSVAVVNDPEP